MIKCTFYRVVFLRTADFGSRLVPIVFLADGKPGYVINMYTYWMMKRKMPPSTYRHRLRALCHLYAFTFSRYENSMNESEAKSLLGDFIDAKFHGTDHFCLSEPDDSSWLRNLNLHWRPVLRKSTIKRYIKAINDFDEWQLDNPQIKPLNPFEEKVLSHWEIFRDFKNRENWDELLHLHGATPKTYKEHEHDVDHYIKEHQRLKTARRQRNTNKAFPVQKFGELVDKTPNYCHKLCFLLMGGTSLRLSDVLNMFFSDVAGRHSDGTAAVIVDDPTEGMTTWFDQSGNIHHSNRRDYITNNFKNHHLPKTSPLYNLLPRTEYTETDKNLWAGFKGMTFHFRNPLNFLQENAPPYEQHHLIWIHPWIGIHFYRIFLEYQRHYYWTNRHTKKPCYCHQLHPWLLIRTTPDDCYGHPIGRKAIYKAWKKALKRIGMEKCELGPHSLRHMVGNLCAQQSDSENNLTFAQGILRHSSIESTQIYFKSNESTARDTIYHKTLGKKDQPPRKINYNLPPHWGKL